MGGPRIVRYERDVTAADLKVNDAYDLTLLELASGHYELVMFMKLQFFFEDRTWKQSSQGGAVKTKQSSTWTGAGKAQYVAGFVARIKSAFDGKLVTTLPSGKSVTLRVRLQTQIGGFMLDHWEITVRFMDPADRSSVNTRMGNVNLSSKDLTAVTRFACVPSTKLCANHNQTTAVHEFAHMIGLDDEYGTAFGGQAGRPWANDHGSLLNVGGTLRPRHKQFLIDWVNNAFAREQARSNSHWAGEIPPA